MDDFEKWDDGLTIGELKSLLEAFNDDEKVVHIYLKLLDEEFPDKSYGIVFEIENFGDNNGNLDLWISDSFNNLSRNTSKMREMHRKEK